MEEYIGLVSNVGFPIAAFFLMWKFSTGTIKENTQVLRELKTIIKMSCKFRK